MTLGYESTVSFKKSRGSYESYNMSSQNISEEIITDDGGVEKSLGGPAIKISGSDLINKQWSTLSSTHLLNYSSYGITAELLGVESINGVDYHVMTYTSENAKDEGPIGLQLHGNKVMSIDFRHLKVKELPKTE